MWIAIAFLIMIASITGHKARKHLNQDLAHNFRYFELPLKGFMEILGLPLLFFTIVSWHSP